MSVSANAQNVVVGVEKYQHPLWENTPRTPLPPPYYYIRHNTKHFVTNNHLSSVVMSRPFDPFRVAVEGRWKGSGRLLEPRGGTVGRWNDSGERLGRRRGTVGR
jgi:hypothetical protein